MKKILLIDNEAEILDLMKSRLEANHYEVVTAQDGEEGISKVSLESPDLIMVDIKMPKMDGYTFVKELRREEKNKRIPVIVLTSYANMQDLFAVEGISDYVTKPFEADVLLTKIKTCFKNAETQEQKGRL